MKYRMFALVQTETKEEGGGMRIVASTATTDRMKDIVEQDWKLDNFKANPVLLWSHDPSIPPVGRAMDIGVEMRDTGPSLVFTPKWDTGDHNQLANTVAEQFRNGTLNAVSVGFRPGEVTARASLADNDERRSEQGMILSKNELLEISPVTIPANAQALAIRAFADGETDWAKHLGDDGGLHVVREDEAPTLLQRIEALEKALASIPEIPELPDLEALTLDAVRNDPTIRAAIIGHVDSMAVDEAQSLDDLLKGHEQEAPIKLADFLKG